MHKQLRRPFIFLLSLLILSATWVGNADAQSLLVNGDFSNGTTGWTLFCSSWGGAGSCTPTYSVSSKGIEFSGWAPYKGANQTVKAGPAAVLTGTVTVVSMQNCYSDGAVFVSVNLLDSAGNSLGGISFGHHPYVYDCTGYTAPSTPTSYSQNMPDWKQGAGPQDFRMDIGSILKTKLTGVDPSKVSSVMVSLMAYSDFTAPDVIFGNLKLEASNDDLPPSVGAVSFAGTQGSGGWYTSPVTATLTATAGSNPIDHFDYTLDGTAGTVAAVSAGNNAYTGTVAISADGRHSLTYRAVDTAGSQSGYQGPATVNIDQTPPTLVLDLAGSMRDGAYVNSVTPTIQIGDGLSGVDSGKTAITLNGAPFTSGTAVTAPGSYTLAVAAADKAGNTANQTVQFNLRHTTALKYAGDTTANYSDSAHLSAVLTDTASATPVALSGQSVRFSLDSQNCTGSSDSSGSATCSVVADMIPGNYPVGASYAGNDLYYGSNSSTSFTVNREQTALQITSSNTLNTESAVVTAQLQDDEGRAVAGRTVTFTAVSNSGTTVTGTGVTDGNGTATATLALSPEQYSLSAGFAGDGYYVGSNGNQNLYVYQATQFVIWGGNAGGLKMGADYTFWGAQWYKQVTGGSYPADARFKGYAGTVSGSAWTARPGDSSTPPATVAKYIGVLVTTQLTQSGEVISGNVAQTVVLKVDTKPAYGPAPGTPGSGVLVTVVH